MIETQGVNKMEIIRSMVNILSPLIYLMVIVYSTTDLLRYILMIGGRSGGASSLIKIVSKPFFIILTISSFQWVVNNMELSLNMIGSLFESSKSSKSSEPLQLSGWDYLEGIKPLLGVMMSIGLIAGAVLFIDDYLGEESVAKRNAKKRLKQDLIKQARFNALPQSAKILKE